MWTKLVIILSPRIDFDTGVCHGQKPIYVQAFIPLSGTRYAHHYPESLRHGVEVLGRTGYVLVTVDGKDSKKGQRKPLTP